MKTDLKNYFDLSFIRVIRVICGYQPAVGAI